MAETILSTRRYLLLRYDERCVYCKKRSDLVKKKKRRFHRVAFSQVIDRYNQLVVSGGIQLQPRQYLCRKCRQRLQKKLDPVQNSQQ